MARPGMQYTRKMLFSSLTVLFVALFLTDYFGLLTGMGVTLIAAVSEGYATLMARMTALEARALGVENRIDVLNEALVGCIEALRHAVEANMNAAGQRQDAASLRLDAANQRLDATNQRIDATGMRLDASLNMILRLVRNKESSKAGAAENQKNS